MGALTRDCVFINPRPSYLGPQEEMSPFLGHGEVTKACLAGMLLPLTGTGCLEWPRQEYPLKQLLCSQQLG